jgi:adenylate cyclase
MHILTRGDIPQRLRLISGLILFVFALTHFLNTAIGIVSLEQMDEVDQWRRAIIRSVPATIVLASALVIHILLALYKLATATTLRRPPWEIVQIVFGLLIPFLLFPHIVNTRIASSYFGVFDNYLYELARLWPANAILQSTLLLLVWIHGCMGIHFWLRLSAAYRAVQPVLLFLAIVVPLAALAGFAISGRFVEQFIRDPARLAEVQQLTRWPNAAANAQLADYRGYVRLGFLGMLGIVAAVFVARGFMRLRTPTFAITYAGGPTVNATPGQTLLEISRANNIPHASVCGGRSRCSTCRVRIEIGGETLPAPVFPESVTLAAIEAPPNVRLACQIRPEAPLTVSRLLRPANTGPSDADTLESDSSGTEKLLAVLYVNMREFTDLTQTKLPYDVVFVLNEFFGGIGEAVKAHGGFIDNIAGDGMIAVFGNRSGPETGCRQALRALRAIDLALDEVNSGLEQDLGRPVRIAAGLHIGPLILGRIGQGEAVELSAIGNAVKIAIQLQTIAKERDVQLVLSHEVATRAGWTPAAEQLTQVSVAGADEPLEVIDILRGRDLVSSILAPTADEPRRPRGQRGAQGGVQGGQPPAGT